jgi:hypothetical protein
MCVQTFCLSEIPEWTTPVDACDWQVLFVHAICTLNLEAKQRALRNVGFWFMDSEQGGVLKAKRCQLACLLLFELQSDLQNNLQGCVQFKCEGL